MEFWINALKQIDLYKKLGVILAGIVVGTLAAIREIFHITRKPDSTHKATPPVKTRKPKVSTVDAKRTEDKIKPKAPKKSARGS